MWLFGDGQILELTGVTLWASCFSQVKNSPSTQVKLAQDGKISLGFVHKRTRAMNSFNHIIENKKFLVVWEHFD